MNPGLPLALALAALLAVATAAPKEDKYTDKYDNINVNEVLSNERLYKKYMECLLADNDNNCPADGKHLRMVIPDALVSDCRKCTEKQKSIAKKVIDHLRKHKPSDWTKLQAKWDSEGKYLAKLADALQ